MEKDLIKRLYETWGQDDLTEIDFLVEEKYTIFSDLGDAWEGQTLDRETYRNRLLCSRKAFPDLTFAIAQSVHEGDRVAVIWNASGTHLGDLHGLLGVGESDPFVYGSDGGTSGCKIIDNSYCGKIGSDCDLAR